MERSVTKIKDSSWNRSSFEREFRRKSEKANIKTSLLFTRISLNLRIEIEWCSAYDVWIVCAFVRVCLCVYAYYVYLMQQKKQFIIGSEGSRFHYWRQTFVIVIWRWHTTAWVMATDCFWLSTWLSLVLPVKMPHFSFQLFFSIKSQFAIYPLSFQCLRYI